ncbi:MAG: redoxin family protein [Pirellulales bacterium]|nr:redoxin family protein [Pirellulales bacterium]
MTIIRRSIAVSALRGVATAWCLLGAAVAAPAIAAEYPEVLLTEDHAKHCRVRQGDSFPSVELPLLGGAATPLAKLQGAKGTVVVIWAPDRWMARAALADLATLLGEKKLPAGIAVAGIAVGQPAGAVQAEVAKAKAAFPQLLDERREVLAAVGERLLPRIYVLDAKGRIVWFDVEYGEATRRELRQSLKALQGP